MQDNTPLTVEAVIFDFDGLILDTETPDFLSWQQLYATFGCELPLDIWNDNIGAADLFNPYTYLETLLGRALDREVVKAQRRRMDEELLAAQVILPGVEAYLAEARQSGLKIGLASSSRHEWVDRHLERLGLLHWFDVIRCRDDVDDRSKPDPAVYLAVLDALGVEPQQALALEDSPNGVLAARRAGICCIAVPNEMTRLLNFDHASYHLSSLADMTLPELIAVVTDAGAFDAGRKPGIRGAHCRGAVGG